MAKKKIIKKRKMMRQEVREDYFAKNNVEPDFMDREVLSKYITERGKIVPRSRTGLSAKNQRKLTVAIKRARFLAILPYIAQAE